MGTFKVLLITIVLAVLFVSCAYKEPLVVQSATRYSKDSLTDYLFVLQFPSASFDIYSKNLFMPGDTLELAKRDSYILKSNLRNVPDSLLLPLIAYIPDSVLKPYRTGKLSLLQNLFR